MLVVVGGDQDPESPVSSVEMYNRRRGVWSQGPHTNTRRDCCRLTSLDGNFHLLQHFLNHHLIDYVYAVGGYDSVTNKILNTCER